MGIVQSFRDDAELTLWPWAEAAARYARKVRHRARVTHQHGMGYGLQALEAMQLDDIATVYLVSKARLQGSVLRVPVQEAFAPVLWAWARASHEDDDWEAHDETIVYLTHGDAVTAGMCRNIDDAARRYLGANGMGGVFCNHSSDPNCRITHGVDQGDVVPVITALRSIRPGEFLSVDYGPYYRRSWE